MKLNEGRFQKCAILLMNVQPPTSLAMKHYHFLRLSVAAEPFFKNYYRQLEA